MVFVFQGRMSFRGESKMNRPFTLILLLVIFAASFAQSVFTQVPDKTAITILRAEDERRFDSDISELLKEADPAVRARAALAAGRIGDDNAVSSLASMLGDKSFSVSEMAMFALGEIESAKASDAVLSILRRPLVEEGLRARAVEAAGKIAAANSKDPRSKELGEAILNTLDTEDRKGDSQSRRVILLALTAALRARPADAEYEIEKYFTNKDARTRADALNAYARLRGKTAVKKILSILLVDEDAVARANAARALGAAADKIVLNALLNAAETDDDLRVRVSALRSIGSLAEPATADRMMARLGSIFEQYKKSSNAHPVEQNELLEAAVAIGRIAAGTKDEKVLQELKRVSETLRFEASEVESAIAAVDPAGYWSYAVQRAGKGPNTWRSMASTASAISSIADFLKKEENSETRNGIAEHVSMLSDLRAGAPKDILLAIPSFVQLIADLDPPDADKLLRSYLSSSDIFVRAAAASAIGDRPATPENVKELSEAFKRSLETDNDYNDAQMAILSAVTRLDKITAGTSLALALKHLDYLVRRRAYELVAEYDLEKEFPDARLSVGTVGKATGNANRQGQVLNTSDDYKRTIARRNAGTKAFVTTEKGKFTVDLFPEQAPLTVDNFVKLAEKGYFNGIDIHRVVANFVVQDGDPRGDGNGGPGWQIRCEINTIPYERGMVGMALSGKDTGGSQWFITHSPQPHLDGGYTVFGKVNDEDMMTVDKLVRGDKILKIEITRTK